MSEYINKYDLQIHPQLITLLNDEILPGLDRDAEKIWAGFSGLVAELAPVNKRCWQSAT